MRHDDYTTVTAAAKQFGISPRHLRHLLQRGVIAGVKPSRDWLVRPSAVRAYLRREVTPGPSAQQPPEPSTPRSPISVIRDAPAEQALTLPQAAQLSGLSQSHIRNLVRSGTVQAHKVGRDWVVTLSDLLRYKQQARRGRPKRY